MGGTARKRWRSRWLAVHLWLGLALGLPFALLGLTGSALVFYTTIDGWLEPSVVVPRNACAEHGLDDILAAIRAAHPARTHAWRIEVPAADAGNRAVTARYYHAASERGVHFAPALVTVDPCTLAVRASRQWGETAMTWIYDLHYTLLLDDAGITIVTIVGLVLLVSIGTGLWLWWPTPGAMRKALRIKWRASGQRLAYDLHKLAGVYGLVVVATLTATGALLGRTEWFEPLVGTFSPLTPMPHPKASTWAGDTRPMLSLAEAARRGSEAFPGSELRWIETPEGADGTYRLRLYQPGDPSHRFPWTYAWVDPRDGRVLARRDLRQRSAGDAVLAWTHPLHNGEAFGLLGRWLAFVGGLLPVALAVTGFLRWRQKNSGTRKSRTGLLDR